MPQETTKHSEVLAAITSLKAIADIAGSHDGHYDYEIDLEVIVYGRNYSGKKVGPYVHLLTYSPGEDIVREGEWGGNTFYFIVQGQAEVFASGAQGESKIAELPAGAQFGEMSVLAGVPRAATVRAPRTAPVQVLKVDRPALRLLRKLPQFGESLDAAYRRYGRSATLRELGAARQLSGEVIKQLEEISLFRVYSKNHVLFQAGQPIKSLYLLKSGWARLAPLAQVTPIGNGEQPRWEAMAGESYLGPSHCFGLEGITRNSEWTQTGVLLGRTEVLEISISKLRQYPDVREALLAALNPLAVPADTAKLRQPLPIARAQGELIETGLVDGTNLLLMDMELCVRCGNCSMACHQMHGQSRLLRRGIHVTRPAALKQGASFQSLLSPSVCMHCQDPECLTGCPTGAIGRFGGGEVDIDPKTCIGCGDCATQCPYNAISMVPRKPKQGEVNITALQRWFRLAPEPPPAPVEQTDDLLAVKCNLCSGTSLNPPGARTKAYSCEENCPTGALLRVDPRTYFAEIKNIEGVVFKDTTHAVARHTSHKDAGKRLMHALGLVSTLALTALTVLGLLRYGLETPLVGSWLDLRWLTGFVGLAGIAGVMAYPVRRQIYKRRAGPLRYWMLAHSYLGVIAGIVLLLHGGTRSGGALTTALMISFDLVILTGLFGILCYYFAPRLLTRIEGQPLLIEDLTARRDELSDEIGTLIAAASEPARALIQRRVLPRFLSFGHLLRQYSRRESLEAATEAARREFQAEADGLPAKEREGLLKAAELAATMRRVDALIYLHQTLKLWLAPHVLVTSLMLALLLVHIVQVVYFAAW
jgi:Fe-S-cluster-containing dehydrogenase component/CRP-like cAMP-binding protein